MTGAELEPWKPGDPVPTSGALTADQRRQVEDELIKHLMLSAAKSAPPGGRIRFRAIDRSPDGDSITKEVTISTQDALAIRREIEENRNRPYWNPTPTSSEES